MKNARLNRIVLWSWLGISSIILIFLCYNYINSLDIIYYHVYAWPATPTLTFTMSEISDSIASYKLIHGIAILYIMISSIMLLYFLKSQNNNNE